MTCAESWLGIGCATPHGGGSAGGGMILTPRQAADRKFLAAPEKRCLEKFFAHQKFFRSNFSGIRRCLQFVHRQV